MPASPYTDRLTALATLLMVPPMAAQRELEQVFARPYVHPQGHATITFVPVTEVREDRVTVLATLTVRGHLACQQRLPFSRLFLSEALDLPALLCQARNALIQQLLSQAAAP